MELLHAPLRAAFDALFSPLAGRSPWWTLLPLSVVFGILALLLFKWTSNQKALEAARRRQHAGFFEIRLFNDDLRAILGAQGRLLAATGRYFLYTLVPLLCLLPPFVLLVAQMQFYYGYRGLEPGQTTLLRVDLDPTAVSEGRRPALRLELPAGVEIDAGPVWVPVEHRFTWRLRAAGAGEHDLGLELDGRRVSKSFTVADTVVRRSPIRPGRSWLRQVLYPSEPPLPADGPFREIRLDYPDATVSLFGWQTHWLIPFFLVSVAAALLLRKRFGVTI